MFDYLLVGGKVATGLDVYEGNIGIKDGKIAAMMDKEVKENASQKIDVTGSIVIPGAFDIHTHCKTPYSPVADSLQQNSISGAYGGITTFFAFIGLSKGTKDVPGTTYKVVDVAGLKLDEYYPPIIEEGKLSSVLDFGLHCVLAADEDVIRQIPTGSKVGITSWKMVLGYHPSRGWAIDDRMLMMVMENIASSKGLAMFHCENGYVVGYLEDKFAAEGKYDAEHFLEARPNILEAENVYRISVLSKMTGCPFYVVHLSTKEGLDNVIRAKSEGIDVVAETCPQYLLLTDEDTRKQGALVKIAPPLRSAEDAKALWQGIRQGFIETVGSDHAAFDINSQKLAAPNFLAVPFGLPGIETMLPLMYSEGVAKERITLNQLVQVLCTNPAKKLGLYPRKGSISLGADADLVVIDPKVKWEIRAKDLHSNAHYTPYEGWQVAGKPVMSFLRGKILLKDGQLHQKPGFGLYIHRPWY
jgi:dihydropyrimidinase